MVEPLAEEEPLGSFLEKSVSLIDIILNRMVLMAMIVVGFIQLITINNDLIQVLAHIHLVIFVNSLRRMIKVLTCEHLKTVRTTSFLLHLTGKRPKTHALQIMET